MLEIALVFIFIVILIVTALFFLGLALDFFRPSNTQIQLLGIHLTLFGAVLSLSTEKASVIGVLLGLMGLSTGVYGAFKGTKDKEP